MMLGTSDCNGDDNSPDSRRYCAVRRTAWLVCAVSAALLISANASRAQTDGSKSAGDLAKTAQNPVADMISLPFQNNTNFNVGPLEKTQNVLNIQPVYPLHLNKDWNLITRTILPVISQPAFTANQDREFGLGDIQISGFFSPKVPTAGGVIWGAGVIA